MTVVVINPGDSSDSDETNVESSTTSSTRTTDNPNKAPLEGSTTAILSTVDGSSSSITVAIVLPVIICTIFVAALITFFVWRRKRSTSTVILNETVRQEPSAPEEVSPEGHPHLKDSCYAVMTTEREVQDDVTSDGYSAVDEAAAERDQRNLRLSYNHVPQTDIQFVIQGYSHVTDSNVREQTIRDNPYTQVNKVFKAQEDDDDTSYNKLNNATRANMKIVENKDMIGEKSGYNHCIAGRSNPEIEGDGYSHLNS